MKEFFDFELYLQGPLGDWSFLSGSSVSGQVASEMNVLHILYMYYNET